MLRDRYGLEADALWTHLQHLAEKAPRLEGLYARGADPRVTRLVQSAAFAFAVAEGRLSDDGQALVRPLVARALPECLRPRPSSTILQLSAASGGRGVPAGGTFTARSGQTTVPFQLAWSASLGSVAIEGVALDRLDARRQVLRFALVAREGVALGGVLPEVVRLFLHVEPRRVAFDLLRALRGSPGAGETRTFGEKGHLLAERRLPRGAVSWVRIDTEELPLVSARPDRFASSTLLRDLFAFPESFCFFDLRLGPVEGDAHRVEVVLPLAQIVEGCPRMSTEHLRLGCAPATNQFVSPIEPAAGGSAPEIALTASGRRHAEILEVRGLSVTSIREAGRRTPLRSWETPETPHTFEEGEVYFALEQRSAPADGRTELRALFGRLGEFPSAPGGTVEGEVLACDGMRTDGLGLGDVGSEREGATNITRVTPSRRALLGQNHAWRMSAYARMPPARLAEAGRLAEFLRLHDPYGIADEAVRVQQPAWRSVEHQREHELTDGVLGWGDAYVASAGGGPGDGELWLVGALVHRALAERTEALRFARLVVERDGAPFAEYAARHGARFPFPLG